MSRSAKEGGGAAAIRAVRARRISHRFGGTFALRDVDVDVGAGELLAIEGANGSGKSTLLGVLGARIAPTAGRVEYEPAPTDAAALRASLGWLAHESWLYGDLAGRRNLQLAAELHGVDPVLAWDRLASSFELEAFADRPVRTCSRGQRQRLGLARAFVHEPSVVLLDEPTTGLDAASTERLASVLAAEARAGRIVMFVTHDAAFTARLGARRVVLEGGRRVA